MKNIIKKHIVALTQTHLTANLSWNKEYAMKSIVNDKSQFGLHIATGR